MSWAKNIYRILIKCYPPQLSHCQEKQLAPSLKWIKEAKNISSCLIQFELPKKKKKNVVHSPGPHCGDGGWERKAGGADAAQKPKGQDANRMEAILLQGLKKNKYRRSHRGSAERNLTNIHEDAGLIPGLAQWLRIQCCHELWCRSQIRLGSGVAVAVV